MATSDQQSADLPPLDGQIIEFEAVRNVAAGAKLRLMCSHWLQFDDLPAGLAADQNASRAHSVVILPQYATNDIELPGARFECRDFLTLRDLRAFRDWLDTTFSGHYERITTSRDDVEFVLAGESRSLELCFRYQSVGGKFRSSVIGHFAEPPLQRESWKSHWKWVTESPRDEFAYACEFAFFFDSECLRTAALELGEFLHRHGA